MATEKKQSDVKEVDDDSKSNTLFTQLKIGQFTLNNRIALSPMTRGRATDRHVPTDIMATYYSQRADALLISEATGISRQGLSWYRTPGIWNDEQVQAWTKITSAVHNKKGIIGCQLWHQGRNAHSDVTGEQIVSASDIALPGNITTVKGIKKPYEKPKSLNKAEIKAVTEDFAKAAVNALKAGFDFVEVHGANGYLVDQFLQSCSNKRKDEYGGTAENRLLFMKEVIAAIIESGVDRNRIGIRLSPNGTYGNMGSADNIEVFSKAIEWLTQQNLLYIHVANGVTFFEFHGLCDEFTLRMTKDIMDKVNKSKDKGDKNTVKTILIGNVGYSKETAEEALRKDDGDLIAFGRPFIANADLVYRFKNNIELEKEAEYKYWWGWQFTDKGYIDWPLADATK